jgi:hypothetical protein
MKAGGGTGGVPTDAQPAEKVFQLGRGGPGYVPFEPLKRALLLLRAWASETPLMGEG